LTGGQGLGDGLGLFRLMEMKSFRHGPRLRKI
jgi:hypothetical protein